MRQIWVRVAVVFLLQSFVAFSLGQTNKVLLESVGTERLNQLVHLPVEVESETADLAVKLSNGKVIPAQKSGPWLLDDPEKKSWVTFVVPEIGANEAFEGELIWGEAAKESLKASEKAGFSVSADQKQLLLDGTTVLSLEDAAYDPATTESRDLTYKVFHHVYFPGIDQPITKGPGGLFPHHRGLFYGFNKIGLTQDGKKVEADTWHAKKAFQQSQGIQKAEAGRVFARQVVKIDWMNEAVAPAKVFASELREYVVLRSSGQVIVQFSSRLESEAGEISLKGDPQHAGFQFRASQEVADDTKGETYYVRPDGIGQKGEFRNWPDQQSHVDLPFHAMSFVVSGQRLTCLRLDRASNPHPARYSERDYGRFGSYFEYALNDENPLEIKFQLRFQAGEISVQQAKANSDSFWDSK